MFLEIMAGVALGSLVGLLIALSTAHVVGSVIAALVALLGGFFGLQRPELFGGDRRIASFGLACVLGVLVGLPIRNGMLLAPSPLAEVQRWTTAGYSPEEARSFVAFQRLGIKPFAYSVAPPPALPNTLFAGQTSLCSRILLLPDEEKLRALAEEGGASAGLAAAARAATNSAQALAAGVRATCG